MLEVFLRYFLVPIITATTSSLIMYFKVTSESNTKIETIKISSEKEIEKIKIEIQNESEKEIKRIETECNSYIKQIHAEQEVNSKSKENDLLIKTTANWFENYIENPEEAIKSLNKLSELSNNLNKQKKRNFKKKKRR